MTEYRVYTRRKRVAPDAWENRDRFWLVYEGPLDETIQRYASNPRRTFCLPDIADKCLWLHGKAILPLTGWEIIVRSHRAKREIYKYNGIALCLELDFDERGIRRKPVRKGVQTPIPGSYDRCVHSTKRQGSSWRVYPTCGNPHKFLQGKRHHLPHKTECETCPAYRYDRQLMNRR